jgi:hypothetical protein
MLALHTDDLALPLGQAAPQPPMRRFYQLCWQRVTLDVAANRQNMLVMLDRKTLESSLMQRPAPGTVALPDFIGSLAAQIPRFRGLRAPAWQLS